MSLAASSWHEQDLNYLNQESSFISQISILSEGTADQASSSTLLSEKANALR